MSKRWLIVIATILLLMSIFTPSTYAQSAEPIFKDGSIIWNSPVGPLRLILGQPNTGGWFSFPYLYTCFRDNILVWNFIDGYPKLVHKYHEPGAKDIVMYDKYLLVQVKDGINIYEMDTPTTFVTYGGIYLPCDNGHLLWGTSQISPTVATVHVSCPDGHIYGLHRWDFKPTTNFRSVDHPIPIPPMVWDKIMAAWEKKALVSSSIPLFIDIPQAICETEHYIAVKKEKDETLIIDKSPPYTHTFSHKGEAICGSQDTIAIWQKHKDIYKITIWSKQITSSITLPEAPTSIYGSYDHFLITTPSHVYLVSTMPSFIVNSSTLPEPATLQITGSVAHLVSHPIEKKILWFGISGDKFYLTPPHTATKITKHIYKLNKNLSINKENKQTTYFIKYKNKIYIIKDALHPLPGTPLKKQGISIDFTSDTIWWISTGKVKHCHFSPATLHFLDTLTPNTLNMSSIWCLDTPQTTLAQHGYPLYVLIPVFLFILWIGTKITIRKQKPPSTKPPRKTIKQSKKTTRKKRGKQRRKVWRYGS